MNRRDFLKLASMAGLGVVAGGIPFLKSARADATYQGPLWIMLHASGGWDPTSLCDPKGTDDPEDPKRVNNYAKKDIGQAGSIRYAPIGINKAFVENRPSFAALVAGVHGPEKPMAFITYGGYETSAGVVAVTRVGSTGVLQRVAYPERLNPSNDDDLATYHSAETSKRIKEARQARHEAYAEKQNLPRIQQAMSMLYLARTGQNDLQKLTEFLPGELDGAQLKRQAQVAFAAFRAGVCVSANLALGGFDTHGNHDQNHFPRLQELLEGVDFILDEAEKYPETKGNVVVVVGSDFGRTPSYNSGNGKDHWSITSMMLAGKGIPGGKVIGATDDKHSPLGVNPKTLEAQESGGARITPGHVHAALRRLAGVDTSAVAEKFPLSVDQEMPLFG
jgi:uncharacterized protein (DUF1501 family)